MRFLKIIFNPSFMSFPRNRTALLSKEYSSVSVHSNKCPVLSEKQQEEYNKALPYDQIPGPRGFPLIGIGYLFLPGGKFHKQEFINVHRSLRQEYGDLVKLKGTFGKPDMLIIFDPDDMATVTRTEGAHPTRLGMEVFEYFRKHERPDLFQGSSGLVSDQGEQWYKMRSLVNPVMMQPKTVKLYISAVEEIANDFIDRIREIRNEKGEMPDDFFYEINKWSLESIASIGLDQRLGLLGSGPRNKDALRLIEKVDQFFDLGYELDVLPSPWKYFKTPAFRKFVKVMHEMTNITSRMVEEAEEKLKNKPSSAGEGQGVFEKLLKLDRKFAVIMALDMLMAGVDTTSMFSVTVLYHLAKNPDKQQKLREEIMQILPNKDSRLTTENMANMPYLRACIKEASRINPVTLGTARWVGQDLVLKGYQVPKDTNIALALMITSNQDKYFGRSAEYLPERFLKSYPDESIKSKHPFAMLPFGFGPRMCIGKRFADLEMEVLLAKIIRNFVVEWNHPDLKFINKMIMKPGSDLKFGMKELD